MQIEDALGKYLIQLQADGRSSHTTRQYARHGRLLAHWLSSVGHSGTVNEIGHEDLARFLCSEAATHRSDGKPKKASSVNALRSSLRVLGEFMHCAGYADRNPARLIKRARCGRPRPKSLTRRERARLYRELRKGSTDADRRDLVLVRLLLGTGLRLASALELHVDDIDLNEGLVVARRAKGNREHIARIGPGLVRCLELHLAGREGLLFPGARPGKPLCARQAQKRIVGWMQRAGVRRGATVHSLRHSFAMDAYERIGDIEAVRAMLGHRSVASTAMYLKYSQHLA